ERIGRRNLDGVLRRVARARPAAVHRGCPKRLLRTASKPFTKRRLVLLRPRATDGSAVTEDVCLAECICLRTAVPPMTLCHFEIGGLSSTAALRILRVIRINHG